MLVFTNRVVREANSDESAFAAEFKPGSDVLGMAHVARRRPRGRTKWSLSDVTASVTDTAALDALVDVFEGDKPVLVHLHGNSMTPALCFERCMRFEELFKVAVIGFSWPSEGLTHQGKRKSGATGAQAKKEDRWTLASVTAANHAHASARGVIGRYKQAKTNGKNSVDALARFLELVGRAQKKARAARPFSVAAHSLGAHCLQMLVEAGFAWRLPEARNIALLAACVPKQKHEDWVPEMPRSGVLLVTTNVTDWVLFGAMYADGFREKLGGAYATPPRVDLPNTRYVDFARRTWGDHEYFIAEQGKKLDRDLLVVFTRCFGSEDDLLRGKDPCTVYLGCCDEVLQVCSVR